MTTQAVYVETRSVRIPDETRQFAARSREKCGGASNGAKRKMRSLAPLWVLPGPANGASHCLKLGGLGKSKGSGSVGITYSSDLQVAENNQGESIFNYCKPLINSIIKLYWLKIGSVEQVLLNCSR